MTTKQTLTFVLMDAPFESARTTTAFRLLHAALTRGCDVNVFAYGGAVALSFAKQAIPTPCTATTLRRKITR